MFNVEESLKPKKIKLHIGKNCKKIGAYLITFTFIMALAKDVKADKQEKLKKIINVVDENWKKRFVLMKELRRNKTYDSKIIRLYQSSNIIIEGREYNINELFIVFDFYDDNYQFHLISNAEGFIDILNKKHEKVAYNRVIPLKNTSIFIKIINNSNNVVDVEKRSILVSNVNELIQEVCNWDGMIHDQVIETDSILEKQYVKKEIK